MRDHETARPTETKRSVEAINGGTAHVSDGQDANPDAIARNRFDASISYSRRVDSCAAQALKRELQRFAEALVPAIRRERVDDTNLAVDSHLWLALRQQIDASSFFILFASPEAAQSDWVATESGVVALGGPRRTSAGFSARTRGPCASLGFGNGFAVPGSSIERLAGDARTPCEGTAGRPRSLNGSFFPADVRATFSNCCKRFVTVGDTAEVWNRADGQCSLRICAGMRDQCGGVQRRRHADCHGRGSTTVRVWNPESGAEVFVFRGHTRQVRALSFAGSTQSLLSASQTTALCASGR